MELKKLTQKNFATVVNKYDTVVVLFSAIWCEPCQAMKKQLSQLAQDCPEVIFAVVDIEQEKSLAEDFDILSIPALMILRYQSIVCSETGVLNPKVLSELVAKAQLLERDTVLAAQQLEGDQVNSTDNK